MVFLWLIINIIHKILFKKLKSLRNPVVVVYNKIIKVQQNLVSFEKQNNDI